MSQSQASHAYHPLTGEHRIDALKRALTANALTETDLTLIAAILGAEETRAILRGRDSRAAAVRRIQRKVLNQRRALRDARLGLPVWARPQRRRRSTE